MVAVVVALDLYLKLIEKTEPGAADSSVAADLWPAVFQLA